MNQSYAFVGTSYLDSCEDDFKATDFKTDDGTYVNHRYNWETNFIQAVSKRYPDKTIYNCSESGHGVDLYHRKVLELIKRYDPDTFVLEIPEGERYAIHTKDDYVKNYGLYFPVQIWKAGLPQNLDEPFRKHAVARIDSYQALESADHLNEYWSDKASTDFICSDANWRGYKQILSIAHDGVKSRHFDVLAQCIMINQYLISKGKRVYWFYWSYDDFRPKNELDMNMISKGDFRYWVYKETTNTEPSTTQECHDYFKKYSHDNKTHLHSKYMPKFAGYFDEIFK